MVGQPQGRYNLQRIKERWKKQIRNSSNHRRRFNFLGFNVRLYWTSQGEKLLTDFSEKLVVKEKVPVINGGTSKYNNLQLVHGYCNRQYNKMFPSKGELPKKNQIQEGCKTIRQLRSAEIS